jgi:hypothetical protein
MDSSSNSATDAVAALFAGGFFLVIMVVAAAFIALFVWMFWRIFKRAGMNPALAFLAIIPSFGFIICLILLAFSRWPIEDALAGTAPHAVPPGSSVLPT